MRKREIEARVFYRLFHVINRKYVCWPDGRGFKSKCTHRELAVMMSIENREWGGNHIAPFLEMHVMFKDKKKIKNIYTIQHFDCMLDEYRNR